MKEQFATYEIALKLKELGFNEPCFCHYIDNTKQLQLMDFSHDTDFHGEHANSQSLGVISAPLWQQLIDWFREKHNLSVEMQSPNDNTGFYSWTIHLIQKYENATFEQECYADGFSNNFYTSRKQAILKSIEIIKNKQNGILE